MEWILTRTGERKRQVMLPGRPPGSGRGVTRWLGVERGFSRRPMRYVIGKYYNATMWREIPVDKGVMGDVL